MCVAMNINRHIRTRPTDRPTGGARQICAKTFSPYYATSLVLYRRRCACAVHDRFRDVSTRPSAAAAEPRSHNIIIIIVIYAYYTGRPCGGGYLGGIPSTIMRMSINNYNNGRRGASAVCERPTAWRYYAAYVLCTIRRARCAI